MHWERRYAAPILAYLRGNRMWNSISGRITEKRAESLCLDMGGLEWDIAVPAAELNRLPPVGEECRIFTWLYVREDQVTLYGFADSALRSIFLELIKVEGIGPRGALRILGGISQEELERALETEDISRLEAVPGLGKKTAQKMILALRGKLVKPALHPESSAHRELTDALAEMGYDRRAAAEALLAAETQVAAGNLAAEEREKALFKQAIINLSGP